MGMAEVMPTLWQLTFLVKKTPSSSVPVLNGKSFLESSPLPPSRSC